MTNIGSVPLNSITVTDDTFAIPVTCSATSLGPGASTTCTASAVHIVTLAEANAGNVHNSASVRAQPPSGPVVSASDAVDTAISQEAALTISKSALPVTYGAVGQVVNYSFFVTNTGHVTIFGPISVNDDQTTDESCPAGNINPGAFITCFASHTVTQGDLDTGLITNSAFATGTDTRR